MESLTSRIQEEYEREICLSPGHSSKLSPVKRTQSRPSLYDKAFLRKYHKQLKEEKAIIAAKNASSASKMAKTSVEMSLQKAAESIDRALATYLGDEELTKEKYILILHSVNIFRELQNKEPPIPKIMKTRVGFEYKFFQHSWEFLSRHTYALEAFLKVLMQPRPTKHYLVKGLTTLNVENPETLANDFLILHQEQLTYRKNPSKKPLEETDFTPKICKKSTELDQSRTSTDVRTEVLFNRQWDTKQKIAKQVREKLKEEYKECTFKPQIISKNPKNRTSIDVTSRLYSMRNAPKNVSDSRTTTDKELEQCSFHPFVPNKSAAAIGFKPKGYSESIERIRTATKLKEEIKKEQEKRPCGENYEKMRKMPVKEFQFATQARKARKVLVYVDVGIGPGKSGRIAIHEDDDPIVLAKNFCNVYKLNEEMQEKLQEHLTQQKLQVLSN